MLAALLVLSSVLAVAGAAGPVAAVETAAPGDEVVECSICGLLVDEHDASRHTLEGVTYYFCGPDCKGWFRLNSRIATSGIVLDVVCGRPTTKTGGASAVYEGRRIYFHDERCRDLYLADPKRYATGVDFVSRKIRPMKALPFSVEFEGRIFHFENEENRDAFMAAPISYVHAECPVCGRVFLRDGAAAARKHGGKTRYFCSEACLEIFEANRDGFDSPVDSGNPAAGDSIPHPR